MVWTTSHKSWRSAKVGVRQNGVLARVCVLSRKTASRPFLLNLASVAADIVESSAAETDLTILAFSNSQVCTGSHRPASNRMPPPTLQCVTHELDLESIPEIIAFSKTGDVGGIIVQSRNGSL